MTGDSGRLRRARRIVDRGLDTLVVLLMTAMALDVLFQVASRYLLAAPSPHTEEIARFLLVWVGLLGGCVALRRGLHTRLELLEPRLGRHGRRRLARLGVISIVLFAAAVLIVGGGHLVLLSWRLGQTSAALGLPLAVVYAVLPLTGLLLAWYATVGREPAPEAVEPVSSIATETRPPSTGERRE